MQNDLCVYFVHHVIFARAPCAVFVDSVVRSIVVRSYSYASLCIQVKVKMYCASVSVYLRVV